ncbi:hypothetical protein KEM55_004855, partial [Ascosphaera atra]
MGSFDVSKTASKEQGSEVLPYDSIGGPTYVTAQTLVQQVAYALSDKLFTYSPETFDLDVAVKEWAAKHEKNANGYATTVQPMETRQGAGTIALGYMFSPDFDIKKRHIPQSILASSATLQYMRPALEQLSLLYSVSNPLVAHISAVDFRGGANGQLVPDYHTALRLSEDLGLGLVSSYSTHEAQHMALFATLLAKIIPTINIYDGIKIGRESTRVIDVLTQNHLNASAKSAYKTLEGTAQKHLDVEGKLLSLLEAFNGELGTDYKLFEYHGHPEATSVLVTFGTVESSLTAQIADAYGNAGVKVGVINVRVYRPFVEEEFLKALPASVQTIGVLGQVPSQLDAREESVHSPLYEDVLATVLFGGVSSAPKCLELKYPSSQAWTPTTVVQTFQEVHADLPSQTPSLLDESTQQFSFWDLDDSVSPKAFAALTDAFAKDATKNVNTNTSFDNLTLGGVVRTDIRRSAITLDAPYSVDAADVAYIGDVKILAEINVLGSVKQNGAVLVNAPGLKDDELEKKLPAMFRKALVERGASLYLLDSASLEDPASFILNVETSFIHVAMPALDSIKTVAILGGDNSIAAAIENREKVLRKVECPESWATVDEEIAEKEPARLLDDITATGFAPFDKSEEEEPNTLNNWQDVAKTIAFKEAFNAQNVLRPDLATKTYTITVSANRRLTPETYE